MMNEKSAKLTTRKPLENLFASSLGSANGC